jgi:hypothetical protein
MSIYRGAGGAGDAVADSSSEALLIRNLVAEAQVDADAAAASATAAAGSASSASTSATNAANSAASVNLSSIAITGGSINGTTVGATTASTGRFTNLAYTGTLTGGTGIVNLGSGQFYKDASGNVGVGTASPTYKLDVSGTGTVFSSVTSTNGTALFFAKSATGSDVACILNSGSLETGRVFSPSGAAVLAFAVGSTATERMRIDSAGNVGIGTVNPVSAGLANYGSLTLNGTDGSVIYLQTNASSAMQISTNATGSFINAIGASLPLYFSTNSQERMRIDSSGNVGIGTSSPASKLHINYTTASTGDFSGSLRVTNTSLTAGTYAGTVFATADTLNSYITAIRQSSFNGVLTFGTNVGTNATSLVERMRIDSNGNLLVGTSGSTNTRLLVNATRTDGVRTAIIDNAGNTDGNQCLGLTLGTNTNNTSSYFVVGGSAGADRIYIYGNGNIVNSNNSYGALSDQAIKENIVDATSKLNDLMQVKIRNYSLIADESKTKQIGVVAQELEEVFPSMVETDGMSGHKQVKYSVFVPMLIKAIQEQQAMIETLTTRLNALESK